VFFHSPGTIRSGRNGQLLVTVGEIALVVLEIVDLELHRLAHGRERAVDADDGITVRGDDIGLRGRHGRLYTGFDELRGGGVEIDIGAFVIEVYAHVWVTLRCFDHGGVERAASD